MVTLKNWLSVFLIILGFSAIVIAYCADLIGFGGQQGFGIRQILIVFVGVIIIILGFGFRTTVGNQVFEKMVSQNKNGGKIYPRFFICIAISVLFIIYIKTPVMDTLVKLIGSNLSTLDHINLSLANIFSPDSGKEVLPSQVQQMLALMQTYQITNYRLSDQVSKDLLIKARIIEAAWPIKMEKESSYLLIFLEEVENNPKCNVIGKKEEVALVFCH